MLLTCPPGSLRGAERPRVDVHPSYAETYGPEAVELLRRAGKVPDQWQADALDEMLAIRPDGRWACFEYVEMVSRQNGKGGILEGRALAGLFLLGEELLMWSAHEYKTAMEAFRRVLGLLRNLGERVSDTLIDVDGIPIKVSNTNGEEGLERLDTGQRLKFIARSKSSGRGFSGDVNFIDEAFAYTGDQHEALMFTMSARPNPQIIYASSPPLDGMSGKILFALRKRALAGGDPSLGYRDWGAAGDLDHLDQIDMDDRTLWAATNPALGVRISLETIERERRSMTDNGGAGFARERLGVWPVQIGDGAEGWAVIAEETWGDLADPSSQLVDPVAFGLDITPDRAWGSIGVAGRRGDGLGHLEVVDHRNGTGWMVDRVVELMGKWQPCAVTLDAAGPAGALLPDLKDRGIDVHIVNAREAGQACGALYDDVVEGRVRHLDQPDLNDALAGAKKRPLGDAWGWDRRHSAVDISPLVAVTLARHAFALFGPAADYDIAESVY
ncbi:MAG TPA: hypothetical protein VIS06_12520 [Mycobacteriales bacterium]